MTSAQTVDVTDHISKCRLCLKEFEIDDTQIKITKIVEIRFEELTSYMLKTTDQFSNVICEPCNNSLRSYSAFRKEIILKQTALFGLQLPIEPIEEEIYENATVEDTYMKFEVSLDDTKPAKLEPQHYEQETSNYEQAEFYVMQDESTEDNEEIIEERLEDDFEPPKIIYQIETSSSGANKSRRTAQKAYKRATCGLCNKSYYKDQLQRHIDKVHYKVKRYFCDLCGFGAFLKCNLSTHMSKHVAREHREQIHCTLCPSTFTRPESLRNHMKTEHGENSEILLCFCGKQFNLRHKLTTHIKRTHNNIRDHHCEYCPKKFFTPKELSMHVLKSHTPGYVDKTEYACKECGKRLSCAKGLKTHMKHHKEPEFKCTYEDCSKGFITRLLLRNHMKTHVGQKDFMCHSCDKSFFSANHLRRHIAVSHDKIRIQCFVQECKFSVGRKDYLRNHIISSHKDLPEDVRQDYLSQIRSMKLNVS